ncbi:MULTISPECIES: membrane-bound lytic murein transglycosylase MltC [Pasteurellaceae]|uniref:Membrane-bound lytic murein transglycosylase C n=1 Tax=Pasteurella atlantica TaxID=2827233 RepID=A0AAW8CGT7_9PAST|nr:membrane-bound lytic murein transglycosylase MltC [Pasteurella atlantica]MBR0573321.1 membrane-bound lytic murein transglycosylase MltC [Pasteurella atlantica]MDP8040127.1 membrane-bound lytic murein transglycosylase MltC [Pasteurella atlantica]MDP8042240.1 membrane-bound lytic murein transglycosylase MltC [Pasteurella atlantica]MDP8044453.1 membrane-bound lytic murein transglycosylase MltC [Pasteurella atlantica]MDP8046465.1 membrane-bound lytic murein transglycosylase MltC [Pasteurella at
MKIKKFCAFLIIPFLVACGSSNKNKTQIYTKDTRGLDILTGQFSRNIDKIWGVNELLVASKKDYVKYTDRFYTRSHISFDDGRITIETLGNTAHLRNAIIHTLLMGNDASGIDLFAAGDTPISSSPFLQEQVVDHLNHPVTNIIIANNFATYLLQNKLKQRRLKNGRTVTYVTIMMIANHIEARARKYLPIIRQASQTYGIQPNLILAIMRTESSFNPYAVSYANAIGLMQVVPRSAGRDVFEHKGQWGKPSRDYLYNPQKNIDAGVHYLHILKNEYLAGITHPVSKRYAMISSYNSGAGAVLKVFDRNKSAAIERINHLSPSAVYRILTTAHPSSQARNYLLKVNKAYEEYKKAR